MAHIFVSLSAFEPILQMSWELRFTWELNVFSNLSYNKSKIVYYTESEPMS